MRIPLALAAIGFNSRPMTWRDFTSLCESESVLWMQVPMNISGLYIVLDGIPCIALSESLPLPDLLLAAWHEVAHHLFDSPELYLYSYESLAKAEVRANAIALCCLIPLDALQSRPLGAIAEDGHYSRKMLDERVRVFERFGI